jgi:hypothetical protein
MYKVVLENDRVRVLDARGKPGDRSEMHAHPAGVAITLSGATVRVTLAGGQTVEREFTTDEVRFMEPIEHAGEIVGPGELRVLIVELK